MITKTKFRQLITNLLFFGCTIPIATIFQNHLRSVNLGLTGWGFPSLFRFSCLAHNNTITMSRIDDAVKAMITNLSDGLQRSLNTASLCTFFDSYTLNSFLKDSPTELICTSFSCFAGLLVVTPMIIETISRKYRMKKQAAFFAGLLKTVFTVSPPKFD